MTKQNQAMAILGSSAPVFGSNLKGGASKRIGAGFLSVTLWKEVLPTFYKRMISLPSVETYVFESSAFLQGKFWERGEVNHVQK